MYDINTQTKENHGEINTLDHTAGNRLPVFTKSLFSNEGGRIASGFHE